MRAKQQPRNATVYVALEWVFRNSMPNGECIEYVGYSQSNGRNTAMKYGIVIADGKRWRCNRLVYFALVGTIDGAVIMHTCDNTRCVNPSHLVRGTHADNMEDRNRKGRQAMGERNGNAKLSNQDVRSIRLRRSAGEKGRALAREYGVDEETVSRIHRSTYRSLDVEF